MIAHFILFNLDFVQFYGGISERAAGKFVISLLMNSAFGYAFRKEITNLQSASSESARQRLYKVEVYVYLKKLMKLNIFFVKTVVRVRMMDLENGKGKRVMAACIKAFGSGVSESFDALVDNAKIIVIGSAASAATAFLVSGAPMAWLAAKITSLVLGAVFGMNLSVLGSGLNSLMHRTSHSVGNIVASLWIPFFLVLGLERIAN